MVMGKVTPRDAATVGWRGVEDIVGKPSISCQIGAHIINKQESDWDSHFFTADGVPYMFEGVTRRVLPIDQRRPEFMALLVSRYSLLENEDKTKGVVSFLKAYAITYGAKRETKRFSSYDSKNKILYISRYNGEVWRLDGESITVEPNGKNVFFLDDDGGVTCEADIAPHGELLPFLFDPLHFQPETPTSHLTPTVQKALLLTWFHALGFPDLFPAKPLLLIEGEAGSGKTVALQCLQTVLTGRNSPLIIGQKDEEDFGVQILLSNPMVILDNMDTEVRWLRDSLCAYATAGGWRRRKKYQDAQVIDIRPNCFVGITSRNPVTFRRDDVADRCVIIRMTRRNDKTDPKDVLTAIQDQRPRLLGEWLYNLNRILKVFPEVPAGGYSERLAGFSRFYAACHKAIGLVEAQDVMDAAQAERDVLVVEDDPLVDMLDRWVENTNNRGREVDSLTLFAELKPVAENMGVPFYNNTRTFGKRLQFCITALERKFKVQSRYIEHKRFYRFWPLSDES